MAINPEKFRGTYRIPSARLQHWNYGWNAAYFVTICTCERQKLFGEVVNGEMKLNEIGKLAEKFWLEIPVHFPFVELDAFVVMPNHVHGILLLSKQNGKGEPAEQDVLGGNRYQNQGKNTLSSIIGSYKSAVTKHARFIHADFGWQSRFHDHIIRNEKDYQIISDYIRDNPLKWEADTHYK